MMTIFRRDLTSRIVACVLLPLLFSQCLPCVTCQQEWDTKDRNRKKNLPTGMIIGIILLGMFCALYAFHCFYSTSISSEDHDVLYSTGARSGVDKDIIESFPFFPYSEVKEHKIGQGGVECAICLTDFEDEDTLRWMPPCSHTFHANCIDVWLSSRSTCPVCRANLSLNPSERFSYPSMDLETGNAQSGVVESTDDIGLIGKSSTWNNNANYTTPRSRSTGLLSSWSMAERFFHRSHSTGHSLFQLGENLDRYTLHLPEDVQRQLVSLNMIRRSHMALPQARSSRQGYRSRSVGSERTRVK